MRAVVAIPPVCDFYFTPHRFSNIGARIVFNLLIDNKLDASFIDFPCMKRHGTVIDIPLKIKYLEEYLMPNETGMLSYFTKYQRFGPPPEECAGIICNISPRLLFISCFAFSYAFQSIEIAEKVKKTKPDIKIIVGGSGVSAYPLYFIKNTNIDFAFQGEAETFIKPFLDQICGDSPCFSMVPNLFWKKADEIIEPREKYHPSVEQIRTALIKTHETKKSIFYSTSISRGCGKQCAFCSNFLTHGRSFRMASAPGLDGPFDRLSIDEKHVTKSIFLNFEDDNLLLSPDNFINIIRKIKKRFTRISFLAENGIDYSLLTPALADTLISLGVCKFNFTLVSRDEKILSGAKRNGSLAHYERLVNYIASKNIPVLSYFICGLKEDSQESVVDVLAYLLSLPTEVGISMFYAIPNLPDFQEMKLFDNLEPYVCNGTSAYPWNNTLSTNELVTAFRLSRYVNLLKRYKKTDLELELTEKIKKEKKLFTLVWDKKEIKMAAVRKYDGEMVKMFFNKIAGQ
jgi:anaerobic magnesium-protoporphyrin IX monomethyl ester cyclase